MRFRGRVNNIRNRNPGPVAIGFEEPTWVSEGSISSLLSSTRLIQPRSAVYRSAWPDLFACRQLNLKLCLCRADMKAHIGDAEQRPSNAPTRLAHHTYRACIDNAAWRDDLQSF